MKKPNIRITNLYLFRKLNELKHNRRVVLNKYNTNITYLKKSLNSMNKQGFNIRLTMSGDDIILEKTNLLFDFNLFHRN